MARPGRGEPDVDVEELHRGRPPRACPRRRGDDVPMLRRVGVSQRALEVGVRQSRTRAGRRAEERQRDTRPVTGPRRRLTQLRGDGAGQQRLQRLAALGGTRFGRPQEVRRQFHGGAHKSILALRPPERAGGTRLPLDGPERLIEPGVQLFHEQLGRRHVAAVVQHEALRFLQQRKQRLGVQS